MEELQKATEFGKWVTVAPKGVSLRGCGIIVDVTPLPVYFPHDATRGRELYHLMTDFGNISRLTIEELESMYIPRFHEPDPKARFERQQALLREVYEQYFMEDN